MKVLGIIAEYNPFHNGHKYHLERSLEQTGADVTVAVISGNFVQRGEPALLNKWIRSEMAVQNGIDLVLELPFAYACNNADIFARGAVGLIDSLGCVDYLSFGSEAGDVKALQEIASFLHTESDQFSLTLKEKMKEGITYPKARAQAMSVYLGDDVADIVESPNNILGIEYLKWLKEFDSHIEPLTVSRHGSKIDGVNKEASFAGATAIRKMIDAGQIDDAISYLTKESKGIVRKNKKAIANMEAFRELITYSIISKSHEQLKDIYSITEGLENKVRATAKDVATLRDLITGIKSKRYTETRIKRILMHSLMELSKKNMDKILSEKQMYGRVLSFNEKGASLIKHIKNEECSSIPIVTNISKESDELLACRHLFEYDILASDVYNLALSGDIYSGSDYRQIPVYVRD